MSNTTNTAGTETPDEKPEGTEEEAGSTEESTDAPDETPEETPEDSQGADESDQEDEGGLDLPSAKAALSKVRQSEAKMRTRLREIEKQLEGTLTQEQVDEIRNELSTANAAEARTLLVENISLKHSLPPELAEALKGDTREELEAHAKTLAKFAPAQSSDDPDLSGGLTPDAGEPEFDKAAALAAARKARNRRY